MSLFGSGAPGIFGSGSGEDELDGDEVELVLDDPDGRLILGSCTGPILGSWIADPEPPEVPLLPPPSSLLAVPAAAASGLWTAEVAPLVTLLALGTPGDPEVDFEVAPEPADPPPADAVWLAPEWPDPPPDPVLLSLRRRG